MNSHLPTGPQQPALEDERIKRPPSGHEILVTLNKLGMLFTKRPLALGESEQDYDNLLVSVSAAVRPGDAIETLLVKDIVELRWEIMRLRRIQASILMTAAKSALSRLLQIEDTGPSKGGRVLTVPELLQGFVDRDEKAIAAVEKVLVRRGKDLDAILAEAMVNKLDEIGPIERMIAAADGRHSRLLRDIDRRREADARRLRIRYGTSGR
ncbi:MAG TPA: hypothetical protein VEZ16_14830 [Microvirga sp.]|nr:hypothetical protein [Microvirga sp.]